MLDKENFIKALFGASLRTLFNAMLLLCLVEGFVYSYHFSYKLFADIPYKPLETQTMTVTIPSGSNARDVSKIMSGNNLVDGELLFMARLYIGRYNTRIQAGTYKLGAYMTPDEICRCICGVQSEEPL